jgi:hypothetical protein
MRDWLLPIAPVAAIVYFMLHPEQFYAFVGWTQQFMQ